jgi:type I restriction enzyme S subunit
MTARFQPLETCAAPTHPREEAQPMIADLQPYPEYKESGVSWIGKIPARWDVRRMKLLLREVDSRSITGTEQLLRVSQYTGVTQRKSIDGSDSPDTRASSLVGYKRVTPNDLVINIMLAWNGSMGVSRYDGIASPAYCVYRFKDGARPWYYHELLRLPLYKGRIKTASTGVVESRLRLYSDDLGRIEAIQPPPEDQDSIVRFIGYANGRLERAIRAKRKVIALLHEQKQAIIHRAVTRGLDPTVPLKPSGIPWLGDIPKHWQVLRAKYLFREVDERSASGHEELLSVSHITGVTPRSQKNITMFKAQSYVGHKVCRPGDLVVNTMWAWMAALGVSAHTGIISPAYAVYRPRNAERIVGGFIDGLLRTRPYVSNIICRSTGVRASRLRLYPEEFFRLPIILPPAPEQERIVHAVATETAQLNTAITHLEREIELLREYRTRLVADVVTGKLDVRPAARHLPAEPTELEPAPETEELAETEEAET